jgi:hypothetical protein
MLQNVRYIESLGGMITHRFPPHILIGDIPASQHGNLTGSMNIVEIATNVVDVSAVSEYGKTAEIAVNVWNNNYMGKSPEKGLVSIPVPEPGPIKGDMLIIPEYTKTKRGAGITRQADNLINEASIPPYMAGFYDTSEYMIGDVAVGIIFLESNGSIDPDKEDWNNTKESNVVSEIQAALNWWAAREPKAKLTFTYDIHYKVPTSYEPINRPADPNGNTGQSLWISDAMTDIGYTKYSSYFDNVYNYDNAIRKSLNTNWAFTIFMIDSSNDTDGQFADNYIAYSYLGGPFLVMNYKNDGYGIANMDAVAAHETGHIFYALDQYTSANISCTERSGYLGIQNQNSAYPSPGACLSNIDSIMRGGISGYTNGSLDAYARQQVGWRDSNANGILDIVDFLPSSVLNVYSPDPTNNNTPTYTGSSTTISTYPNMNPYGPKHNITINIISNVQYRVDASVWMNASPAEGLFDSSVEGFTFTVPQLSDGSHTIEVRALNTAGNWETTYPSDNITIIHSIQVTNPSANPAIILNDNGRARPLGTNISRLNVTVTGNISSVTIDLSPIGGSAVAPMIKIANTDIYTITTNATSGINLTNNLVVNVTDTGGNFNNSISIPLKVSLRGDVNGDGKIDLKDLLFLRRYLAGLEPSINPLVGDIYPDVGDGKVDLKDLLFLRRYLAGIEALI